MSTATSLPVALPPVLIAPSLAFKDSLQAVQRLVMDIPGPSLCTTPADASKIAKQKGCKTPTIVRDVDSSDEDVEATPAQPAILPAPCLRAVNTTATQPETDADPALLDSRPSQQSSTSSTQQQHQLTLPTLPHARAEPVRPSSGELTPGPLSTAAAAAAVATDLDTAPSSRGLHSAAVKQSSQLDVPSSQAEQHPLPRPEAQPDAAQEPSVLRNQEAGTATQNAPPQTASLVRQPRLPSRGPSLPSRATACPEHRLDSRPAAVNTSQQQTVLSARQPKQQAHIAQATESGPLTASAKWRLKPGDDIINRLQQALQESYFPKAAAAGRRQRFHAFWTGFCPGAQLELPIRVLYVMAASATSSAGPLCRCHRIL